MTELDKKLERIIKLYTIAHLCDSCNGGGYNFEKRRACNACNGTGLVNWDFGLAINELKALFVEEMNMIIGEDEKEFHGITDASLTNNEKIWRSNQKIRDNNIFRSEQRKKLAKLMEEV